MNGVAAANAATDNDGIDNTKFQSSTEAPPSTAPVVISKKIVLNEEEYPPEIHAEITSKRNLECENSIGDLDGIRDEYYQVKRKCGSIYDRSDDVNPSPLPPESPAYAINIPCSYYYLVLYKISKLGAEKSQ